MGLSPAARISLIYLVRSAARVVSVVLLVFAGMAAAGGLPRLSELSGAELVLGIAFVSMIAGLVVGWWLELAGGLLILCGFAAFMLVDYVANRAIGMSWIFALFPVAGALYLLYWRLGRLRR